MDDTFPVVAVSIAVVVASTLPARSMSCAAIVILVPAVVAPTSILPVFAVIPMAPVVARHRIERRICGRCRDRGGRAAHNRAGDCDRRAFNLKGTRRGHIPRRGGEHRRRCRIHLACEINVLRRYRDGGACCGGAHIDITGIRC